MERMLIHAAEAPESPDALATVIGVLGLLAVATWFVLRFGSTLLRLTGWCSWWLTWACGSQGAYGYRLAFFVLGTLAWGASTVSYARRRGRWPSAISERVVTRALVLSGAGDGG